METSQAQSRTREVLLSAGGPAAIGVLLCMHRGAAATAVGAAQLPAIIIGVLLLMAPALYIGAALGKVELRFGTIIDASSAALARGGLVLLGLGPALLFLQTTSVQHDSMLVGGTLALILATVVGGPVLYRGLHQPGQVSLFVAWLLIGLGIASSLLCHAFLA